ncbi:MAG: hypothetical protein OXF07_15980, partial [Rhodobacter sp.]|nr:hypothetical protein [Rhodobacter sp.]
MVDQLTHIGLLVQFCLNFPFPAMSFRNLVNFPFLEKSGLVEIDLSRLPRYVVCNMTTPERVPNYNAAVCNRNSARRG